MLLRAINAYHCSTCYSELLSKNILIASLPKKTCVCVLSRVYFSVSLDYMLGIKFLITVDLKILSCNHLLYVCALVHWTSLGILGTNKYNINDQSIRHQTQLVKYRARIKYTCHTLNLIDYSSSVASDPDYLSLITFCAAS